MRLLCYTMLYMNIRNNPIIYLTGKTWKFSVGNRGRVILYFILFVIANSITLLDPLIIAHILNTIQQQGVSRGNIFTIFLYLLFMFIIHISFWAFHGPARVLETANAFLVRKNYKDYLLKGTMDLPVEWHTDHHSGDTIDKIEKGSAGLYNFSVDSFMIIESFVRLLGSYIALVYFNVNASYIVVIMVALTVLVILKFDKILIRQYKELFRSENGIAAKVYDVISNITTVIILRVEKLVMKSIAKKMMQPYALFVKNSKINETKWFLVTVCSSLMVFFVLGSYIYGALIAGSIIAIGTIYALYGYMQNISELFFRFAYMYGDIVRYKSSVMNAEEIAVQFRNKMKNHAVKLPKNWQEIGISKLNFSYHSDEGSDSHLDNISMMIRRGQKIALIGDSGSGKTTLLKIMRGLYTPRHLDLTLDGKRMENGFDAISDDIALIPQDPEIFNSTIKENITIGVDVSLAEVRTYTDMANFTSTAMRLPKKFNSSIVEKGVNLSGGEKQRLALARGLMASADKSIVLLDEPTSSVDFRNEMAIYEHIFELFKDKVIISSIHRLHLLPLFDMIYMFEKGKITASGSFQSLLESSPVFRQNWEKYRSARAE